jgi:ATP-dependent helicase HepA
MLPFRPRRASAEPEPAQPYNFLTDPTRARHGDGGVQEKPLAPPQPASLIGRMSLGVVGQRCLSEREPELGLGVVSRVEGGRIEIAFPASGEKRLYARSTAVLKRVVFREGDTVGLRSGTTFTIESVEDQDGLLTYVGAGQRVREDAISDLAGVSLPQERLLAGHADPNAVFALRLRALEAQARFRQSDVRGFLGGRIDLIPHQFYILHEVAARQLPRVLLADEVGLGKTIEACLILQRLLAVGQVHRALVLVPESLTHQWFVELLRRFNLWFGIFDEERCVACETSEPEKNPILSSQLALCSVDYLAGNASRGDQAVAAGWDLVIVDEAHHLEWTPATPGAAYTLVERLAQRSPGLLLLTATPTQLGIEGHFARLRLLDPARYDDLDAFVAETGRFGEVATIADKLADQRPLADDDKDTLKRLFAKAPARLARLLADLEANRPGAREALLRTLLDQHGTGRVVFRNTRAAMSGFPKRVYCPVVLETDNPALPSRIARELEAEETGTTEGIRYSFKDDPRIDWLVAFLEERRPEKVLLICSSPRKVLAIESALKEKTNVSTGLFHEGLPLVQRDRQAAWFAEPEGAQLLLCSEIGSEGRNFQFAHHLVLFDLPLNPGLLEQRIGRLDRIGQTQPIRIHVPAIPGTALEAIAAWYHRGVDAFEKPLHGGNEFQHAFRQRVLDFALTCLPSKRESQAANLEALIAETALFRNALQARLHAGRDRLLELNSFDPVAADRVLARVRAADEDTFPRRFLVGLLDHFGVRIKEYEDGDLFLDPSHAYVEGFPSLPADGMLATFDRRRAIAREDIRFLSPDHALMQDAIDLLIDSPAGSTAFARVKADQPNLLLEVVFVLETVAESRWHVDRFLAPAPVRVLVDLRGRDLTDERTSVEITADATDGDLHRFLERPGFNAAVLKALLEGAQDLAETRATSLRASADESAKTALSAEVQRLRDLRALNDHVRPEEIALAEEKLARTREAIARARLRMDALRLIVEAP